MSSPRLSRLLETLTPYVFLLIGVPVLVVLGFGLVAIYLQGYGLALAVLIAITTLVVAIPTLWMRRKVQQTLTATVDVADGWVHASQDWGTRESATWQALNQQIEAQLQQDAAWESLRTHALALVSSAAEQYRPNHSRKALAFSLPELLRLTEEVSRRYRLLLQEHIPFIESLNLSTVQMAYTHRDKYATGQKLWQAYRIVRLITPAGWIAEARSQVLNRLFSGLSDTIQLNLKRALLQEVASVAIDLYSGRFKISDADIGNSATHQADQARMAMPPEPLRVGFLGQVSAGKSSIINALIGEMVSEVNALPSTDRATVYPCQWQGVDVLHLIDLPGLDGIPATTDYLLEQLTQCDVVVWVLKANQSARALDTAFKSRWEQWFAEPQQRSRRHPVLIGVLTQVDRLADPHSPNASVIDAALAYNAQLLGLEPIMALSVGEDGKATYHLAQLQALLDEYHAQGLQTQWNRRRLAAGEAFSVQDQLHRAYRLGESLFKTALNRTT
jgi:hypothetical protein